MFEPLSRIPGGMRYYFGDEARLRRAVEDTAMSVFDGWSYEEISTPSVDYYALFDRGMGAAEAHRAFRFTDADGQLLALRPDVTSSVARAAATLLGQRPRPLRLCYAAPIFFQQPRSHAQWRRESAQLGCELIGSGGAVADLEVLAIAVEVLARLDLLPTSRITLNSVEIFNGVAAGLGLDGEARERMRSLVDMRDADAIERFLAPHAPSSEAAAFARLVRLSGKREVFGQARRVITNTRSVAALDAVEELWTAVEALGLEESFEVDLGDVSGLDYYTGLTFKIYVAGSGARAGGGGRYDGLTANFGKAEPAIGFVLDLDALTDVLARADSHPARRPEPSASPEGQDPAGILKDARARRAAGGRVLLGGGD